MARAGAAGGDKAEDLGFVQLHGLTRGQIVGGEDHGHLGVDAALHRAGEDADDAAGDVLDVGRAGLEIVVVHGGEGLGLDGARVGHGGLGVEAGFLDKALDGLLIVEILAHHLVRFKKHGGVVAGLGARLLGQHAQLLDGLGLRVLEAQPLALAVLDLVAAQGRIGALIEIQRTRGHAGGDALALNGDHSICSFLS